MLWGELADHQVRERAMTILREDIDAGRIDFSDIAGTQRVPLTHPGTMLAKQYLKPLSVTPYRLAKDIKVPLNRITAILAGKRAITPDTALRLARYLGTTPVFWINLQSHHDLETVRRRSERRILADVTPLAA
jgi:addiction module HigA family antidote